MCGSCTPNEDPIIDEINFTCEKMEVWFQGTTNAQIIHDIFQIEDEIFGLYQGRMLRFDEQTRLFNLAYKDFSQMKFMCKTEMGKTIGIGKGPNANGVYEFQKGESSRLIVEGNFHDVVYLDENKAASIEYIDSPKATIVEINLDNGDRIPYFEESDSLYKKEYHSIYYVNEELWATVLFQADRPVRVYPNKKIIGLPDNIENWSSTDDATIFNLNEETLCWQWIGGKIYTSEDDTLRIYKLDNDHWTKIYEFDYATQNQTGIRLNGEVCNYKNTPYMFSGNKIIEMNGEAPFDWKVYGRETKELLHNNYSTCFINDDGEMLFSSGNAIYRTNCE